jgi:NitT/TauT family transport system substrate-binding protein
MPRLTRRSATVLALAFTGLLSCSSARAETDVKLLLDWVFQSNQAIFTMASDSGYFSDVGLRVKIDRGFGSADTISKVAAGTYDFGFADLNMLVEFNAKNPGSKVIGVFVSFDATLNAITSLVKSSIRTPKDLVGKRIAAPNADNTRQLFPIFAAANGIDPNSVTWVTTSPNLRDALMIRGEADAVASFASTTILNLENLGIGRQNLNIMWFSELGVDLYGNAVVVSSKFLAAHPEVVGGFVAAVVRGTKLALSDPKSAVASVMKRDTLMREDEEMRRFALLRDLAIVTSSVKANGLSYVDPDRLARTISFVAKAFDISPTPTPSDIFRSDFLPPLADRKL